MRARRHVFDEPRHTPDNGNILARVGMARADESGVVISAIRWSLRIEGPYWDRTAVGTWMNSGWPGFTRSPEIRTRSFSSYKEMLHGGVARRVVYVDFPAAQVDDVALLHRPAEFAGGYGEGLGVDPSGKGFPLHVCTNSRQPAV